MRIPVWISKGLFSSYDTLCISRSLSTVKIGFFKKTVNFKRSSFSEVF